MTFVCRECKAFYPDDHREGCSIPKGGPWVEVAESNYKDPNGDYWKFLYDDKGQAITSFKIDSQQRRICPDCNTIICHTGEHVCQPMILAGKITSDKRIAEELRHLQDLAAAHRERSGFNINAGPVTINGKPLDAFISWEQPPEAEAGRTATLDSVREDLLTLCAEDQRKVYVFLNGLGHRM